MAVRTKGHRNGMGRLRMSSSPFVYSTKGLAPRGGCQYRRRRKTRSSFSPRETRPISGRGALLGQSAQIAQLKKRSRPTQRACGERGRCTLKGACGGEKRERPPVKPPSSTDGAGHQDEKAQRHVRCLAVQRHAKWARRDRPTCVDGPRCSSSHVA